MEIVRTILSKVDGQIVLGNNLRPLFNWLLPEEKIFVIPNGGNYTIIKPKFVFPTFYPNEGHPWVIVEAMAAGSPYYFH